MHGHQLRMHALRRYIVFRVKAIEFLDLITLRQALLNSDITPPNPVKRTSADFADSLRTIQLSWFALFVDKSKDGMNIIELWRDLFPAHRAQINAAWQKMEPHWDILRNFRDRAGFHADKPKKFFEARTRIVTRHDTVKSILEEFERLFKTLLKAEPTELPELEDALDSLLDELEKDQQFKYKRSEFKRYLLIPNTRQEFTSL